MVWFIIRKQVSCSLLILNKYHSRFPNSKNSILNCQQFLSILLQENYNAHDGFVVLHGTDTMAYTASALSFMFENLAKPVILTGSQLPIGILRTDGRENIITSIEIAAAFENDKPLEAGNWPLTSDMPYDILAL